MYDFKIMNFAQRLEEKQINYIIKKDNKMVKLIIYHEKIDIIDNWANNIFRHYPNIVWVWEGSNNA
jgi:hypothetical protein